MPKLPFPNILCRMKSSTVYLGWWSFLGTAYRGSSSVCTSVIDLLTSPGVSHETPCNSAGAGRSGRRKQMHNVTLMIVRHLSGDFSVGVPLFAGVAVAGKPMTSPDGARTIPGWPTLTGPSRLMVSVSLVLLAWRHKVGPVSDWRFRWQNILRKRLLKTEAKQQTESNTNKTICLWVLFKLWYLWL